DGTAVEKMMCHQHKQPTAIKDLTPDVPDEMVAVVERLMQKNPANRYPNCAEVIEVLRPLAQASSVPLQRRTMTMPRVRLARPGAPVEGTVEPASLPAVAPELPRPLARPPVQPSPRVPSVPAAPPQPVHRPRQVEVPRRPVEVAATPPYAQ